MRSIIIATSVLISSCGEKLNNAIIGEPSFVSFQLRSSGVPSSSDVPNTLVSASFLVSGCSQESDNRTITINNFSELHIENLTSGSTGCRIFLNTFTFTNSRVEAVFSPQIGSSPAEVVTGNSATYVSPSNFQVIVEVEKGVSQTLQFKESISIALLPFFGTKTIDAKVIVEDFIDTDPVTQPVPALAISKVEFSGILNSDGLFGYSLQLACTELLEGMQCSNMDLMQMRFRQLNAIPSNRERLNLIGLIEERSTQIIPNSTHLWANGLQFTITTPNKQGEHIVMLALFQNSVRLFDIEISPNK